MGTITGLPFDRYTGKLIDYDTINLYDDYNDFDGFFRIEYDDHCVTDGTGYFPTYFDLDEKRLTNIYDGDLYKTNYISVPMNCIFDYNSSTARIFNRQTVLKDGVDSIFDYFEDWFCAVYENIFQKYTTLLFITTGLDSRYLLSIITSRGLKKPILVTYGDEGKLAQKMFDDVIHVKSFMRNPVIYMKDYIRYYQTCLYDNVNTEFAAYNAYRAISDAYPNAVVIDGLGRNNFMSRSFVSDAFTIQKARTTFTAGRVPVLMNNKIRSFFPYAGKDIRFNVRRLNLSEVEICHVILDRIRRNKPEFAEIKTESFDKAKRNDDKQNISYKKIIELHKSVFVDD